ncbi:hypothetical protein DSAG12_00844 [Promethearchaeum syntrophicum]|uniref:Uncharacterized protein n=1 Tax=Promethearchaeum syntrophicum TaxID=2594042 RepID=A0A5B9D7M7_9ARCH
MLQFPNSMVDLVEWFSLLNVEFKVLIAIIAIPLCMVFIYVTFKLLEIFILLLKVILDAILRIFRKPSKITKKIKINKKKSKAPQEIDSIKQKNDEENEYYNKIDSDVEEVEENTTSEENGNIITNIHMNIQSNDEDFMTENTLHLIDCPNCGKKFSEISFSKIGDTFFVSCEECGKRYITNGDEYTEN